jgi:hypothetical protein
MSDTILIVNAATGERVQRERNADEIAQHEADVAAAAAAETERVAAAAQQSTDRAAAIEHAKSLGFTDAMIAVMYPTLLEA